MTEACQGCGAKRRFSLTLRWHSGKLNPFYLFNPYFAGWLYMKKSTLLDQNENTTLLSQMVQRLPLSDTHFRRISQLIYQRAGIVLADHKREMVYNRLVRRLRTLNIDDFGRYLALLESD